MIDRTKNPSGCKDLTAFIALNKVDKTQEISKEKSDYIRKKYQMLTRDFLVFPTEQELLSLFKCRTQQEIDKTAIRIIITHWDKE